MKAPSQPENGSLVATACGGQLTLEADTPRTIYRGEWLYFCLQACQQDFQKTPATSCLAWRIAENKGVRVKGKG